MIKEFFKSLKIKSEVRHIHKHIKIINGEKVFDGNLNLFNEKLTSLEPYNISDVILNGTFWCNNNNNLISVKGAPKQVTGSFLCNNNNKLISLEGAPNEINGDFYCLNNLNLKSLEGLPEKIGRRIVIEKEVLKRLYFTNHLVSLYDLQDKFILL